MFSKKQPTPSDQAHELSDHQENEFANTHNTDESVHYDVSETQGGLTPLIARPTKPSIISEGFEFIGSITSEGTLNIAGIVKGKISAKSVLVDVEGQVEGELTSETLAVKGKIVGEVICQDLNVGPRAFIDATISYQNIHIQRGGKVAGKFIKN